MHTLSVFSFKVPSSELPKDLITPECTRKQFEGVEGISFEKHTELLQGARPESARAQHGRAPQISAARPFPGVSSSLDKTDKKFNEVISPWCSAGSPCPFLFLTWTITLANILAKRPRLWYSFGNTACTACNPSVVYLFIFSPAFRSLIEQSKKTWLNPYNTRLNILPGTTKHSVSVSACRERDQLFSICLEIPNCDLWRAAWWSPQTCPITCCWLLIFSSC